MATHAAWRAGVGKQMAGVRRRALLHGCYCFPRAPWRSRTGPVRCARAHALGALRAPALPSLLRARSPPASPTLLTSRLYHTTALLRAAPRGVFRCCSYLRHLTPPPPPPATALLPTYAPWRASCAPLTHARDFLSTLAPHLLSRLRAVPARAAPLLARAHIILRATALCARRIAILLYIFVVCI